MTNVPNVAELNTVFLQKLLKWVVVQEDTDATVRELMIAMIVSFYNDYIIFVIILLYLF